MTFWQAILASFIASICAGTVVWFIHGRLSSLVGLINRSWMGRKTPENLRRYLHHLTNRTLQISHPWMKEGQTLGEILVPVGVFIDGHRTDLRTILGSRFRALQAPRIVVVGGPGSGKSIALGDIARYLPGLERPHPLVPVLLTFTDLKGASTKEDLEAAIANKLRRDQFTNAKPDPAAPMQFISDHLYEGDIALLIDGYDELDRDQRRAASVFICEFLDTFRKVPAVLASRIAVYERERAFRQISTDEVTIAPFSPLAIGRFVAQWRFDEGKTSSELLNHINGKAHLSDLASNPLMLTIICFLYSQPKYLLPDNRVEFYRECSRALLEKWDVARLAERANRFESDHKIDVLSRIAHHHISNGSVTDEEMNSDEVTDITREALRALSLSPGEDGRILREIVENSGLLVELPPDGYRFPHRTFLEYFAAVHLYELESVQLLLSLYSADEARWRPTLLMYAGLCRNKEVSAQLLDHLLNVFTRSTSNGRNPDVSVFAALIETSFASPETAEQILAHAAGYLDHHGLNRALIDELGFIAANTKWTYATQARAIMCKWLAEPLARPDLQAVILAAMRCRDSGEIRSLIAGRLAELDLVEVFIQAGSQASYYLDRLLDLGLDANRKRELVEGLREGGHLGLLADIMIETADQDLASRAGRALYLASASPGFIDFLNNHEVKPLRPDFGQSVNDYLRTWGWPLPNPTTEGGRTLAMAIAVYTAEFVRRSDVGDEMNGAAGWLAFLTRLVLEHHGPARVWPICPGINAYTPFDVLKSVWRNSSWKGTIWNRMWRYDVSGSDDSLAFVVTIGTALICGVAMLVLTPRSMLNEFYENRQYDYLNSITFISDADGRGVVMLFAVSLVVLVVTTRSSNWWKDLVNWIFVPLFIVGAPLFVLISYVFTVSQPTSIEQAATHASGASIHGVGYLNRPIEDSRSHGPFWDRASAACLIILAIFLYSRYHTVVIAAFVGLEAFRLLLVAEQLPCRLVLFAGEANARTGKAIWQSNEAIKPVR